MGFDRGPGGGVRFSAVTAARSSGDRCDASADVLAPANLSEMHPAMTGRRPVLHWLLLLALVAMWGSSFMLTKVSVAAVPPSIVVAGRLAIAAVLLVGALMLSGKRLPGWGRHWPFFIAMALVGNCIPFWLISWGQQGIDSGLAGILMAIMPLTTLVLAHHFVAGERLNRFRVGGFVTGFGGIVILVGPEAVLEFDGGGSALVSELAVLAGAVCYAVATIVARCRPDSDALVAASGVMIAAAMIMAPVAAFNDGVRSFDLSPLGASAIFLLGVMSTALATVVYFKLITLAGPSFLSLINYLIPLWAVLLGTVLLGEKPEWTALIALVLVLSGIALSEVGSGAAGPRRPGPGRPGPR
jgi:drug/metabolite transporter (DMT)-like permease